MFLSLLIGLSAMDLSVIQKNQEVMGVEKFGNQYGSHVFNLKDTFAETDVKGNNNLFHSLKTENNDHGHHPSSLFQDNYKDEKHTLLEATPTYSPFKRAIDLRVHNRTTDGGKRTIFEDADYFAKNFCYKLLPITFESVDETIIHTEHNYSLFSLCSESEAEEDCSRTMDYSQIKEKNYKRRRTKFREESEENEWEDEVEKSDLNSSVPEEQIKESASQSEYSFAVQPLDLSSATMQEEKTDDCLRELPTSIANHKEEEERRKEGVDLIKSRLGCIEVTITRPDEKENYQPCDLFLNDIARLVPRLIEKDCSEIDILDRTCNRRHLDIKTHRLYYIISESNWELFQSTNERIILTNDESLGEPVQKRKRVERPTYLVFDQFSLAKCLADYCEETGGCFQYTFLEESRSLEMEEKQLEEVEGKIIKEIKEVREEEEVKVQLEQVKSEADEFKPVEEKTDLGEADEKAKASSEAVTESNKKSDESQIINPDTVEEKTIEAKSETEERPGKSKKRNKKKSNKKVQRRKTVKTETKLEEIPPLEPISRIRTRSMSTSELETPNNMKTSQSSDKLKSRGRKREKEVLEKESLPKKQKMISLSEEPVKRRTRSGKALGNTELAKEGKGRRTSGEKQEVETMSTRLRSRKDSQANAGCKETRSKQKRR